MPKPKFWKTDSLHEPDPERARFTGRAAELGSVTGLLDSPSGYPLPLVMFYGVPGIGKTSLLEHLEQTCEERGIPWAGADLAKAPDARQALECLAHQFTDYYGLELKLFWRLNEVIEARLAG